VTADPMPEVSRAVGRLVSQAYKTTWHLGDDRERAKRVVEILEKAAEEIAGLTESR
jgi:hypothetical protein